jgi:hypothetical protein
MQGATEWPSPACVAVSDLQPAPDKQCEWVCGAVCLHISCGHGVVAMQVDTQRVGSIQAYVARNYSRFTSSLRFCEVLMGKCDFKQFTMLSRDQV